MLRPRDTTLSFNEVLTLRGVYKLKWGKATLFRPMILIMLGPWSSGWMNRVRLLFATATEVLKQSAVLVNMRLEWHSQGLPSQPWVRHSELPLKWLLSTLNLPPPLPSRPRDFNLFEPVVQFLLHFLELLDLSNSALAHTRYISW